jgi:hypothetical protein
LPLGSPSPATRTGAGSKGGFHLRETDRCIVELKNEGMSYAKMLVELKKRFPGEPWGTSRNLSHRYHKAVAMLGDE